MTKTIYVDHPRAFELAYQELREYIEGFITQEYLSGKTLREALKISIEDSEQFWDQPAEVEYAIHDASFDYSYGSIDGTHKGHEIEIIDIHFPAHFPNENNELEAYAEQLKLEIEL